MQVTRIFTSIDCKVKEVSQINAVIGHFYLDCFIIVLVALKNDYLLPNSK